MFERGLWVGFANVMLDKKKMKGTTKVEFAEYCVCFLRKQENCRGVFTRTNPFIVQMFLFDFSCEAA